MVDTAEKVETKGFKLPNKKLKLKPVKKARGKNGEITVRHEANFLYRNAKNRFEPCLYQDGQLRNPLTKEEQQYYESDECPLSFKPGDLAVDKDEKNYWTSKRARITLDENSLEFDLSDDMDYLKYKILLTYPKLFAAKPEYLEKGNPNWRREFLYVFEPINYEEHKKAENYASESEMYRFMFRIENDKDMMINTLTLLNPKQRVAPNVTQDFLKGELNSFIKNSPKRFSEVMKDEDLEYKAILKRGIDKGAIKVEGVVHTLPTGDVIGENRNEAIAFLKAPENEQILDKIKIKIDS